MVRDRGRPYDERALGSQTDLKNAETSRMCAMSVGTVVFIVFVIMTVYLGVYGYNGVDPNECWVISGLNTAGITKDDAISKANAAGVPISNGYPIDMHKIFTVWCRWGMW